MFRILTSEAINESPPLEAGLQDKFSVMLVSFIIAIVE